MEALWSSSCAYRAAPPAGCLLRSSRRPLFVPPSPSPPPAAAAAATNPESRGNRMFVFGTGFVGRYVSEQLKLEGWEVSGTCRSAIKKRELEEIGLDAFLFDVHKSKLRSLPTLQHATHVLISIPPVIGSNDPLLCLHKDLRSLSSGNLQWLCYLSSTSRQDSKSSHAVSMVIAVVLGLMRSKLRLVDALYFYMEKPVQHNLKKKSVIPCSYHVNPESESAKLRFIAEKGWLDLGRELGVPTNILRLGGIYGPGRSALDTIIKRNLTSEKQKKRESRSYTARVHVADIYQAVKATLDSRASGRIYNVADDDPAPREEVFAYARSLIEERWAGMIDELSDNVIDLKPKKRNIGGEKRVSNARLKEELGVKLLYPTYRSGLRSIFDSWNPQFNIP